MLLVHKNVDLSRWCLNTVLAFTPLCSVVCPESTKKSKSCLCEPRSAGFKGEGAEKYQELQILGNVSS